MKKISYKAGDKINGLTFIEEVKPHISPSRNHRKALFRCTCGSEFEAQINSVRNGSIQSCGCLQKQRASEVHKTHGLSEHPLYKIWKDMNRRCSNPTRPGYKNYGGRGIKVCVEWQNSFQAFYDFAMENGWEKGLQIDRINNDGNYKPSNCRFVTNAVNSRNRRTTKLSMEIAEEIRETKKRLPILTYEDIADFYEVSKGTIAHIIQNRTWT